MSEIVFERIICEDTFAFGYLDFSFTSGIHSIVGVNGASKTSILLALSQGLFNRNPKGVRVDDVSNTVTGKPYEITIFFSKGGHKYKVVNSRKKGGIRVEVDGKDISRKTIPQNLELIREILEDAYDTFIDYVYQSSDSSLDLLEESGDSARKNFINKILRFDELDEMLAVCKAKIKVLKSTCKVKQDTINQLRGTRLPFRDMGNLIPEEPFVDKVEELQKQSEASRWRSDHLLRDVNEQEAKIKSYRAYVERVDELKTLREELAALDVPLIPEEEAGSALKETYAELSSCLTELKNLEREKNALKAPELVCSKCGQDVNAETALRVYEEALSSLDLAIPHKLQQCDLLRLEVKSLTSTKEQYDRIKRISDKIEITSSVVDSITVEVADEYTFKALSTKYNASVETYSSDVSKLHVASAELERVRQHNTQVRMERKLNEEAEKHNAILDSRISALSEEVATLEKRIDLLEVWTKVLGPNGYRVHSMNSFLGLLNKAMDKYSGIVSAGKIKCRFFVTAEGKIDFSVVDPDKQVPFANWSKGEQARVKLSCLFAVLDLMEAKGAASYNVLMLDEIFSALDDEGKEGLFAVLSFLREKGKCVYTISHTPLVNPVVFDSTIQVVKENGIATVS